MKFRKTAAAVLSFIMTAAVLTGCGTQTSTDTASKSGTDDKVYKIGICQLVQHKALDAATQGFKDKLTELLGKDRVKFDEQNAAGDSATCSTIVNQFVSSGSDPAARQTV